MKPTTTRKRLRRQSTRRVFWITTGLTLATGDLRDAVPEQQAEQRERAAVDKSRDQQDEPSVEHRAVLRKSTEDRVALEEVVSVREGYEKQHEAAGEVRSQGPRLESRRSAGGRPTLK